MFLLRGGARLAKHKPAPVPSETDRLLFARALLLRFCMSSARSRLISEVEHAALCSEQLPIYHWSETICGCISTLCVLCNVLFEQVEEEMDGGGFNLLPCLSFWVNFSEWKFLRAAQSGHGPTYKSGHLPSVPINSQSFEDAYWVHFAKVHFGI